MCTTILIQSKSGTGITLRARQIAAGRTFRAPHHSCSNETLLGELAIAAGGVLYLDDVLEFRPLAVRKLADTWARMAKAVRPTLILGFPPDDPLAPPFFSERDERVIEALPPIDRHEIVEVQLAQARPEVV